MPQILLGTMMIQLYCQNSKTTYSILIDTLMTFLESGFFLYTKSYKHGRTSKIV
jgi:hypothetical protein